MNPTTALVGVLFWLGTVVAGYFYGVGVGKDTEIAAQAREEKFAAVATEAAASAAAHAISKISVKHTTVRQEVQRDIIEKPVYRDPDCRTGADSLRRFNSAIPGAERAGGGELPAADASD
jgi:hypothetical protein